MNQKSNPPAPHGGKQASRAAWEEPAEEFNFTDPAAAPENSHQELVGSWALQPVSARPPLGTYLAQLFQRRHFIWADARSRAFSGGRGMILGNAWLVLQPILDAMIYFIIFGLVLKAARGGITNFVGYLIIGIFMFQYTMRCLNIAGTSILSGKSLIRAFSFPRAALPVSGVVREGLGMLPVLGTMAVLLVLMPEIPGIAGPANVTWRWLLFPLVFALQTVFNLGIALIASRLTARIPDLKLVIPFLGRFWFYGSGVMFSVERFVSDPSILAIVKLNPMFLVLDMTRDVLLYGVTPQLSSWLILAAWAVGIVIFGLWFFWRAEVSYSDDK